MKNGRNINLDKKNNKNKSRKKYEIEPRFYIILIIIIVIFILFAIMISRSTKKTVTVDDNLNVYAINVSKNTDKIKTQYNLEGQKQKLIDEYNKIQNAVGIYIMNNSTTDENSFNDIIKKLQSNINKGEFSILNIEKSLYWSGNWNLDENANLTFKFSQKEIEPDWISEGDVNFIVTKN